MMAQFKGAFNTEKFLVQHMYGACIGHEIKRYDHRSQNPILSFGNSYNMHKMFGTPMTRLTHQVAN